MKCLRDKWGSDDLRSTSADQGFFGAPIPDYSSNTMSSLSSDEQWRWSAGNDSVNARPPVRTDTLSSSGSTASSEMSSDSGKRIVSNRASELKRKVDKSNSDVVQRFV